MLPQQVHGLVIGRLEQVPHLAVGLGRRGVGAVHHGLSIQILVGNGGQGHEAEVLAHTVLHDHLSGQIGGPLDVVGRAGGLNTEDQLFGGAAAHQGHQLCHELFLGVQVLLLLGHLHGVAQRAGGVGDNGDLGDGLGVLLQGRHQGVAHLVIGDNALFHIGEDCALLFRTGNDHLEGDQQVLLVDGLTALPDGPQGGLVDQIGQVRAHRTGGGGGQLVQVHVVGQLDVPGVDFQGLETARQIGPVHHNAAVEAAGTQQSLVQHLGPVGGGQHNDALGGVEAIHFGQQLVQRLLPLVVAAHAGVAGLADGVDFIDKDDGRGHFAGLLEQVPDAGRAHAHEHLHKAGAGDGEERHIGFTGHGLGQQRFTGTGRTHQQRALGQLGADFGVLLGVVEEVDDLLQRFLGLVLSGHILEGDAGLLLHIHLGAGLADAAESAAHALGHGAGQEGQQQHPDGNGQNPRDDKAHDRAHLFDDFGVVMGPRFRQLGFQFAQFQIGYDARVEDFLFPRVLFGLVPGENQYPVALELHRIHLIVVQHFLKDIIGDLFVAGVGDGFVQRVDKDGENQRHHHHDKDGLGRFIVTGFRGSSRLFRVVVQQSFPLSNGTAGPAGVGIHHTIAAPKRQPTAGARV